MYDWVNATVTVKFDETLAMKNLPKTLITPIGVWKTLSILPCRRIYGDKGTTGVTGTPTQFIKEMTMPKKLS